MSSSNYPGAGALLRVYSVALALYFLLMAALWVLGVESIYAHPTPLYALWSPAFAPTREALLYQLGAMAVGVIFLVAIARGISRLGWGDDPAQPFITPMRRRRLLIALVVAGVALPCAIAMLRGGLHGISQAYERSAYEYIGDIGKAPSISALFTRYLDLMPYLSMHAKVHPPGPIAFLWLLSYFVTQDPLALSFATIVVAALAVVPLYHWTRTILDERVAVYAALLYLCVPSIVLFNATSADALFPVVTLSCLLFFDRALRAAHPGKIVIYAVLAGIAFGLMGILKFSLIAIGGYFAFAGLLGLTRPGLRRNVFITAAFMLAACLSFHVALRLATGFDIIAVFHAAKAQFDLDQHHLDQFTPRLHAWVYRLLNPLCWFYFTGIPIALLWFQRLRRPEPQTRGLFLVFLGTALVLNLLYLARGEGERSALYLFPFLVLPAAHLLHAYCSATQTRAPLFATLAFLLAQTWLTEMLFYTYW